MYRSESCLCSGDEDMGQDSVLEHTGRSESESFRDTRERKQTSGGTHCDADIFAIFILSPTYPML